jgi:hypothetical protein
VNYRLLRRLVVVLLLVWIAVDLTALDTCALDIHFGPAVPPASAHALQIPGTPAHPHAVLHPDHCFGHGLSIGPGLPIWLSNPLSAAANLPDATPGRLHWAAMALDHPPRTLA